ncbi:MAG: hypothetical protein Q4G22_02785 [Paracoccus sp. (in: a-proteobacteria)]|uniref:hypothetical protein n=1 Tax=Paracoccus sp. TaxID=267 RepID=UPI0026E04734|nr:hypothetical protein [Paracoccus sp. (in: a-proteobacteria)]MDO5630743.1 hypothetical protein [Paracoccus sp. (in: a-proteobacteria)]
MGIKATLLALALVAPAAAQDQGGLARVLADYARIKSADGVAPLMPFLPERLLQQAADELGQTVPDLLLAMAAQHPDNTPKPLRVTIEIAPMDPGLADWHQTTDGVDYALLPMQTTMTSARGICATQTTAVAFTEQGRWRIYDIGDPENRALMLAAYPEFADLPPLDHAITCDTPEEK